ncbi:hypothetical protein WN48_03330 [Eufriesea mexicana]|uniref:Uncharacterized protein n=1 Tax=Eufriesea mexicana TaxID=516756 RepID=A0A310SEI8_9HYME|nr:hypothetical protein WN48_03330 [Eufriesea mexicana]
MIIIMYITTDTYFLPKNFIIHTFYGERTCFCWDKNKFIIFPYTNNNKVFATVLTAPALIKTIQCFTDRIFVVCIPQGIYKFTREQKFAVLSKNAIGMGTVFYEVLTPRNKYLYLDNKQKMTNKMLFKLSSNEIDSSKLCVYPLNVDNGLKLFTLINETLQIIYNSIYPIKDIIPVQKSSKIDGLLLIGNTDVITIIHSKDNMLVSQTIYLRIKIQAICAGFSQFSENTLWIVYSSESKLYYATKQLLPNIIHQTKVQDKRFVCLQTYDSKLILGLTMNKQLVDFSIDTVERILSLETDTIINLHYNMLEGATLIMDKIYKEEDKLRRINLYAHKQKIRLCPKIMINHITNQLFLSANFQNMLPKNSWVILNVKSGCKNLFSMKKVIDQETTVDLYIPKDLTVNFSQIGIDIIAFKDERYPWCLIRDYIINPHFEQTKKRRTRQNSNSINYDFVNSKIVILQTLIQEKNVNIKKLSEIKKSLRKQLGNT